MQLGFSEYKCSMDIEKDARVKDVYDLNLGH